MFINKLMIIYVNKIYMYADGYGGLMSSTSDTETDELIYTELYTLD